MGDRGYLLSTNRIERRKRKGKKKVELVITSTIRSLNKCQKTSKKDKEGSPSRRFIRCSSNFAESFIMLFERCCKNNSERRMGFRRRQGKYQTPNCTRNFSNFEQQGRKFGLNCWWCVDFYVCTMLNYFGMFVLILLIP